MKIIQSSFYMYISIYASFKKNYFDMNIRPINRNIEYKDNFFI